MWPYFSYGIIIMSETCMKVRLKMDKLSNFFRDRSKRHIVMVVVMVPVIVIMLFLGFRIYKDAQGILSLVKGDGTEVIVNDDHKISSMNYVLRENETELQMSLFTQLKDAVEGKTEGVTEEDIAKLVAMNHIADFYTWTNKLGQYDVGGLYYVNSIARENVFIQARDTFYKYFNEYMDKYGVENLLEVASIDATVTKNAKQYPITRSRKYDVSEYDIAYEYTTTYYDAYDVKVTWTYKDGTVFSPSKYPTSTTVKVINNTDDGRYDVVVVGMDMDATYEEVTNDANE